MLAELTERGSGRKTSVYCTHTSQIEKDFCQVCLKLSVTMIAPFWGIF